MSAGFTLLRPDFAWAAIPLLLIAFALIRAPGQRGQWQNHIDPLLLPHLLEGTAPRRQRYRSAAIVTLCLLGLIALLGPAWQRQATPLVKSQDALVVILDLSASMYAQDIQPSRLQQAKYKIRDLLTLRQEGQTGLVASAGDAFVVAPLTDDGNTLLTLLPSLSPAMMPLQGSNPLAGLNQAQQLLEQGSAGRGRILFVGDGIDAQQWPAVSAFAQDSPHSISVLAVGTADGAPIPNTEGGFIKDAQGNIAVAKLTREHLQELAEQSGGQYRELTLDNSDIAPFGDAPAALSGSPLGDDQGSQRRADQWQDGGIWFVLLMLPLALLGFHRSALGALIVAAPAALLVGTLALQSPSVYAQAPTPEAGSGSSLWQNLWRTPDQQGAALMERDPAAAATKFTDPMWRGSALYRAGDYQAAAEAFAKSDSATAHYNRGNALAQAGQPEEAIAAYEQALEKDPNLEDAARNRDILQQQQEQQEQQQQSQQDGQQGDSDNQSESDSNGESQSSDQSKAEQDNTNPSDGNQSPQSGQNSDANQETQGKDTDTGKQHDDAQQQAQQQTADDYVKQSAQADDAEPENQARAAQAGEPEDNAKAPTQGAVSGRMSEEDQAGEQWLRQIPDSSDQLLRNKFRYQYLQRRNDGEVPDDDDYAPY